MTNIKISISVPVKEIKRWILRLQPFIGRRENILPIMAVIFPWSLCAYACIATVIEFAAGLDPVRSKNQPPKTESSASRHKKLRYCIM